MDPKPTIARRGIDNHKTLEKEKNIKPILEIIGAKAIIRSKPKILLVFC